VKNRPTDLWCCGTATTPQGPHHVCTPNRVGARRSLPALSSCANRHRRMLMLLPRRPHATSTTARSSSVCASMDECRPPGPGADERLVSNLEPRAKHRQSFAEIRRVPYANCHSADKYSAPLQLGTTRGLSRLVDASCRVVQGPSSNQVQSPIANLTSSRTSTAAESR
jgi:hypothetical protein